MRELSVFADESGNLGHDSRYYILSLVFHDQSHALGPLLLSYERVLRERRLPDVPFHFVPLLRQHEAYGNLDVSRRKRLLMAFSTFAWHVPFSYRTFAYRKDRFDSTEGLAASMRRDLLGFLFDNLETLQSFDGVKIYYDDGQHIVTQTLRRAFAYALASDALVYRDARPEHYRLAQIADFACGIEHEALKYENHEEGKSDRLFFGTWRDFNKTFLRKLRKKRI